MLRSIAFLIGLAMAAPAVWAENGHAHHNHGAHAAHAEASPSTKAYLEANAAMHKGMDIAFTGDADIDFLKGMIAHHQGAVDMARIQLKHGTNAQVRKMSREVIRTQELEIRWMRTWLKQLEARRLGHTDKGWLGNDSILMR